MRSEYIKMKAAVRLKCIRSGSDEVVRAKIWQATNVEIE